MTKRIASLALLGAAAAALALPAAPAAASCNPTMPAQCLLPELPEVGPVCVPLPQGAQLCV